MNTRQPTYGLADASENRLTFTKMHGLGNDFMVIDATQQPIALTSQQIQSWAQRHTGIGFDQCLVIVPPLAPTTDFSYHIYNADGKEVEQCGNGVRCVAEYLWLQYPALKQELVLSTPFDTVKVQRRAPGSVAVTFAPPRSLTLAQTLPMPKQNGYMDIVQLANPHVVLHVDSVREAPVQAVGAALATHAHFPAGTNVEFVQMESPERIHVRVYERGVGETQACGTGAMAAVVACQAHGRCGSRVTVLLSGGELLIEWLGGNSPIVMTGSAVTVFTGEIAIQHTHSPVINQGNDS